MSRGGDAGVEGERGFAENVELMLIGCRWHFVVRRLATAKAIHKTQASLSELHLKRIRHRGLGSVLKLKGALLHGRDGIS